MPARSRASASVSTGSLSSRSRRRRWAEGVGELVRAACDVGDVRVVRGGRGRGGRGWGAVGAQDDEIVELGVGDGALALDVGGDSRLAALRRLEADDRRNVL